MDRQKIIAVDFDGTLCTNAYPRIGYPIFYVMDYVKKRQAAGDILILWTCRTGKDLDDAVRWCAARGLRFDYVNENAKENTAEYQNDCRKVFADVYIDDKAMHVRDIPEGRG